jgi:DNA repair protein RadA/Sms
MAKQKNNETVFKCLECGNTSNKYFGVCPKCKSSNVDEVENIEKENAFSNNKSMNTKTNIVLRKNNEITTSKNDQEYLITSFDEFNKLMGGEKIGSGKEKVGNGIVKNSLTLIAGEPGIGKSTLLLQIIDDLQKGGSKSAYISNEESEEQIRSRAIRLGCESDFIIKNENNIQNIVSDVFLDFDFLIIDSIQTISDGEGSSVGGVKSIRENTILLMEFAKKYKKTIFIIGQITKSDDIAGPKVLEHMVDAVLFFEFFDDQKIYRYIQPQKNRNANIQTNVIFEMTAKGLVEIKNPSLLFIDTNSKNNSEKYGSALTILYEANKPIFVEIQSLLIKSNSEKTITQSIGIDQRRIFQISAIISKYLGVKMYQNNIFVNILGGLIIKNTYIDLCVIASILSSNFSKPINSYVFIGEVGLTGEIRKAPNAKLLIEESKKYGFENVIAYETGYTHIKDILNLFK